MMDINSYLNNLIQSFEDPDNFSISGLKAHSERIQNVSEHCLLTQHYLKHKQEVSNLIESIRSTYPMQDEQILAAWTLMLEHINTAQDKEQLRHGAILIFPIIAALLP